MGSRRSKSKRRSGTSTPPEKRLESTVFFIDRTLGGYKVPEALREAGINIEVHSAHFIHNAPDTLWIERCGRENWVVLGNDKRIKKNPLERMALIRSGVAAFFLTSGNKTGEQEAEAIITALKRIANLLMSEPRPFIARIHPDGTVDLWVNHKNVDVLVEREARRKDRNKK